jgi:hypothetical protein
MSAASCRSELDYTALLESTRTRPVTRASRLDSDALKQSSSAEKGGAHEQPVDEREAMPTPQFTATGADDDSSDDEWRESEVDSSSGDDASDDETRAADALAAIGAAKRLTIDECVQHYANVFGVIDRLREHLLRRYRGEVVRG